MSAFSIFSSMYINTCIHTCKEHPSSDDEYILIYVHTYIHICEQQLTGDDEHSLTYVHTYIHTWNSTQAAVMNYFDMLLYIHTYIHTYIHSWNSTQAAMMKIVWYVCIHTYIHTYIHTWNSTRAAMMIIAWYIRARTKHTCLRVLSKYICVCMYAFIYIVRMCAHA